MSKFVQLKMNDAQQVLKADLAEFISSQQLLIQLETGCETKHGNWQFH